MSFENNPWYGVGDGILRGAAIALLASLALLVRPAAAATYDESVSGDLSNDPTSPAPFTLSLGTNSILGTVGSGAGTDNLDAISITVPAGMELTGFTNSVYFGSNDQDFVGFHAGATFAGSVFVGSNYMGLAHFGTAARNAGVGSPPGSPTSTVGVDLLPVMNSEGLAAGASGFTGPLGAGTYTFLIGELVAEADGFPTYRFDVKVAPELGDFNRDGQVTSSDIPAMLVALTDLNFYASADSLTPTQLVAIGDFDNSGSVTNRDIQGLFDLVASHGGGGSVAAVPEPASLVLLSTGVLVLIAFSGCHPDSQ
jgi:hypothetical protein